MNWEEECRSQRVEIRELRAEIERLTEQARGMADVAMKNGEALLLEEAKVRELREVLELAQRKLAIYRSLSDDEYVGGMEYAALMNRITEALAKTEPTMFKVTEALRIDDEAAP